MAYKLTQRTKDALAREFIEPNLVLLIDGVAKKYAVKVTKKTLKYDLPGLNYDDADLYYDGIVADPTSDDLISITGTSSTISQQLDPDKGAASSTQTLTLRLIDRNESITQLITPGLVLEDLMYTPARVFFGLADTAFEDYIEILNGNIMGINPTAGTIDLVVTHPDDLKRSKIFEKQETTVTAIVNFDSATILDIFYQKRPDVVGAVDITYTTAAIGDNANVSVTGNSISVEVDPALTKAKTVRKKIEDHVDARQLVTAKITGDPDGIQAAVATTTLGSSDEVEVESVEGFLLPSGLFKTYLKIDNEIIEYTSINTSTNKFLGCTRQSLTSFGSTHAIGAQVSSFYKLGDSSDASNAIDLALMLLLSKGDEVFGSATVTDIVTIPGYGSIVDAVWVPNVRVKQEYGLSTGDLCTLIGGANTFTDQPVSSIVESEEGTYITFNSLGLVPETGTLTLTMKSKYNILPDGAGLMPRQVDVDQFMYIKALFSTAIADYEFYLKDTMDVKEFINTQIFLPSALYSLPRKGRISVGVTAPPLYSTETQALNITTLKDPKGLKLQRSVNQNFYNSVIYKYNPDSVEDKYLNKNITISGDSAIRIGAPSRPFVISADGLRPNNNTDQLIQRNGSRFLDRYKFGAESIKVQTLFSIGFPIEVGDAVIFGDPFLYLSDTTKGTKDFSPRIMEVINKEWNWVTGAISLSLLDTTYSSDFRYGTFSPTSLIGALNTTTNIEITASFGTIFPVKEKDKWANYIGKEIKVHSEDYTVSANTYIQGFDPGNDNVMIVDPALPFTPLEGYMIDVVRYEEIDTLDNFYRSVHCFFDPEIAITAGVSNTEFTVASGDETKFYVGCPIRIHTYNYGTDSGPIALKVVSITGTNIVCDPIGFVPDSTMFVELIGFSFDNGKPYAYV